MKAAIFKYLKNINYLYVGSILALILLRIAFYIFNGFFGRNIFTTGFIFDIMIDISLVFLLFFIFKKTAARKISMSIFMSVYLIIYLFDYVYHRTFFKIGSATAFANIIFVRVNDYGIKIDYQMAIMALIYGLFMFFIVKLKNPPDSKKRFKPALLFIIVLLIPYAYAVHIYLQISKYSTPIEYYQSKSSVLVERDMMQHQYIKYFGYSLFRYDDLTNCIKNALRGK